MRGKRRIADAAQRLPRAQAALGYASRLHAGQSREADGAPFIAHPREVAEILFEVGAPDQVVAAGALHDVIEKTSATAWDVRKRFGSRIATLVLAVSEDEHIQGYTARKAALREQVARAGDEALMVFAADKLSKARELRIPGASPPRKRRLVHYQRCLALLQERLPGDPLVVQLTIELQLYRRMHAARA